MTLADARSSVARGNSAIDPPRIGLNHELALAYWLQTLADRDVQDRLAANVYRRVLLADAVTHAQAITAAA